MRPEAERILDAFRARGLRDGDFIHFTDFGDAIGWKGGGIRDESVRLGLIELVEGGHVEEHLTGLMLTRRGRAYIYRDHEQNFGARVYRVGRGILVKETVLRGIPPEYMIDKQRQRYVADDDDAAIGAAIRDALNGSL